jgi:hypothetical protein
MDMSISLPVSCRQLAGITLLLLLLACNQNGSESQAPRAKHVIVIGIDGLSPDGIRKAPTPYLDSLIKEGSYTFHARSVLPSSSSTNWASMIMGAGPEQHGITSNGWEPDDHVLPAVVSGPEVMFPTIFSVFREQRPEAEIGAIYNWGGFGRLIEKSAVNLALAVADEYATADSAAAYIKRKKPHLTFVHFDHVDHAGHDIGHGSEAYYASVARADSLIGQIVQAAREAGLLGQTVFIISSDHGGIGKGHGGETLEEVEIPFIVVGKGVKQGQQIKHPVYQYDNAATVAFVLGLEQPYAWIGKPVKSAFEGYPAPTSKWQRERLSSPAILPVLDAEGPAGGLFVDEDPLVEMKPSEIGHIIRFTLDGSEPTAASPVYQSPFVLQQSTVVKAKSFLEDRESLSTPAFFRRVSSKGTNGLTYRYYEGEGWDRLPDFSRLKSVEQGSAREFRIGSLARRANQFALVFEGQLKVEEPGEYTFYTQSDDGSKLFVNGREVVNNDGDHGTVERRGKITLTQGLHPIQVHYFNGGGAGWLDVYYRGPGIPKQIIPGERLFPSLTAGK